MASEPTTLRQAWQFAHVTADGRCMRCNGLVACYVGWLDRNVVDVLNIEGCGVWYTEEGYTAVWCAVLRERASCGPDCVNKGRRAHRQ